MSSPLLHGLLEDRMRGTPDAAALRHGDRTWTYREVGEHAGSLAAGLRAAGVGAGDRVLVLSRNQPDIVPLLYAVSGLGAVFAVVSDQVQRYHLEHIVGDCDPALVLGDGAAAERAASLTGVPVLGFGDLPAGRAAAAPSPPRLSVDPVSLIYTSGSTAMPKAVVSTHAQVRFAAAAIHGRLRYRAGDVVFCCLPLSFDYGLYQVFLCCLAGCYLVLGGDADAGPALLGRLREENATVFPLVPGLASTLTRLATRSGAVPERLRLVTNTGSALPGAVSARMRELIPGLDVVPMYGLTECKRVSIEEPNADLRRPGSAGRPLPDTDAYTVDRQGRRLPAGEVGELVVRGPHVMAGYWRAPELTARRFRRDALGGTVLHTGDRCRLDEDGNIYVVGRDDDIYKQRGLRVSALEVEAAALDVPGVEQAALVVPDESHPARLVVTGAVSVEILVKELSERLERGKLPGAYHLSDRLPRNVNGKTDRAALRAALDDAEAGPR